ncbi:hypothetical protein MMC26_000654 [Xylographa opegraphella]|nr:hypothetical protein [Xylographa opegraphella]
MPPIRILIINPNSTSSMTHALKPLIDSLDYTNTQYTYYTAPSGPPSVNNSADIHASTTACLADLSTSTPNGGTALRSEHAAYDGYLVACYSRHGLVTALRAMTTAPVVGIFEASVAAALQLLDLEYELRQQFGIVSTGAAWEALLGEGVGLLLGTFGGGEGPYGRCAGVETTGLNATELHSAEQGEVKRRVQEAVRRLVEKGTVRVVLLGCAGMAGMDGWVREVVGERVRVVDGVKAGVGALQGLIRGQF